MRVSRVYTSQVLTENVTVSLRDNEAHYLARVLRLPVGAALRLFNGQGGEYVAEIAAINKREVVVHIGSFISGDVGSRLAIHLGQVISRGERMDMTLQKATELGVAAITPLFGDYCNVKLDPERLAKKQQHWQAIITSACEQSGRTLVPTLFPPESLKTWIGKVDAHCRLVLDPQAVHSLKDIRPHPGSAITLLIGCEGGLSDPELAEAVRENFMGLKLGPRILRTETAALAAISALQTLFGDFG